MLLCWEFYLRNSHKGIISNILMIIVRKKVHNNIIKYKIYKKY